MSLGNSTWKVSTGGGSVRASSQAQARAVVHFDVSPLAAPNVLLPIGDVSAIPTQLGVGRGGEVCAFTSQKGQSKYFMSITPSLAGALSAVVQTGVGVGVIAAAPAPHKAITILCTLGGVVGTAKVQFSVDGGVTYGPVQLTAASLRVLGTYTTANFAAATYVATKTNVIGIDGTVTPGSGWVGVVTHTSSPVDDFEIIATINKTGALGAAIVQVSLDNGNSTLPGMLIPAGGVVVIPDSGIFLTCTGASFSQGDVYQLLSIGPGFSGTDLNNALTALKANPTVQASMLHLSAMPSTAAAAFSAAATLDAAVLSAFANGSFDWEAACDCPSKAGGMRITSTLTGRKHLRPLSWLAMDIYCRTDPKDELAAVSIGPLRMFIQAGSMSIAGPGDIVMPSATPLYDVADTDPVIISARGGDLSGRTSVFAGGRDESQTPGLDDVQINTARTYGGPLAAFLSITSGVGGWKNLTTNASYVDAGAVRGLNVMIAALRPVVQQLMGLRPTVNLDGTISEAAATGYDTIVDGAVKRALGLVKNGDYIDPQASSAFAVILRTSQLGQNPKRLDVAYGFQPLGEITAVANLVNFSGVLSLTQ